MSKLLLWLHSTVQPVVSLMVMRKSRSPRCPLALLMMWIASSATYQVGCGDDGDDVGVVGGNSAPPVTYPSMVCDAPERPATSSTELVVGDGTAASCNEAALRSALEEGAHVTFDCGGKATITLTEPLTILDGTFLDGGNQITLDGADATRLVEVEYYATVVFVGVTFQNGHRRAEDAESGWDNAGAIYTGGQSDVYIEDCRFYDNVADATIGHGGGAIYPHGAHLTVVGSEFRGNSSPTGGAIHSMLSNTTLVNCVFEDNEADDGGAVFVDGAYYPEGSVKGSSGETRLCGCRFVNNRAQNSSGAMFLCGYTNEATGEYDRLMVDHCEFRNNVLAGDSPSLGGALRIHAEAEIRASLFAGNDAADGQGGAVWAAGGDISFENTTFYANSARWGGAVRSSDETEFKGSFVNCTFAKNAGNWGGALDPSGFTYQVRNSIFSHNGEEKNDLGYLWTCAAEMQGSNNLVFPEDETCGLSFTTADPLLEEELADDALVLRFDSDSPAQGAGSDCPELDQLDQSRPIQGCDLGAVEVP